MKRFVPCFLALLLLLTACSGPEGPAGNPSGDPEPTPAAQGHALPKDNRDAAGTGAVFTDDNGWYICAAGAVSYYDYASGRTMALCAQPGCSHRDASCQAWVGNVNSFAVLDGVLYATLDDAGSGASLVRKELSGGKVTVLEQWDNTDNHFYTAALGRFSCGKATLHLECRITEQQADGRVESRTEGSSLLYDLAAGSYRELSVPGTLMGFSARWGAVVEVLKEFPELVDPRTGRSLMERTIIICNTSSMPVAAREASVYTAVTMAEYYRQMGLDVLLLADSPSRWAQAMREMSGRLEEIPGEEAFPAYLESVIASFYERAGKVRLKNGKIASVTIGGTVSPAGGNFEEPVTQATLKVVGAFHGLSRERSDARKYPAIHPIDSWSKYRGVVDMERVEQARSILKRSNEINQMMKVIGEEGTSAEDYIVYQKGELLDAVYLQQNSFDPIDAACDPDRQIHEFNVLYDVLTRDFALSDKKEIRAFFNQVRQEFLDWHNTVFRTPEFEAQEKRLKDFYLSKAAG